MSKSATLLFITVLVLSSFIMVSCASAESIPEPSVPEFTLKLEAHPYDVPPAYSIDPYTGESVTSHEGVHVENKSIVVTIKNQYCAPSSYLFYNVRYKGNFGEDWTELYSYSANSYSSGNLLPQSSSEYTVLSIPAVYPFIDGAVVDFQVEALLWHDIEVFLSDHPMAPPPINEIGHYETKTALHSTSGWSNTQTLTIAESQTLISPSPTFTPYKEPHLTEQEAIIGVAVTVAVLAAGLGLLVYLVKRK